MMDMTASPAESIDEDTLPVRLVPEADGIPARSPEKPPTERVQETVNTIRKRKKMFTKYSRDIVGKTGLGAIAALA